MRREARRSIRHLASAAAAILTAFCILGWGIAPADPAAASSRADAAVLYHECGHLERFIGVVAHDLSCRKALTVARAFLAGNHHPLGFRCKRVNVNAAAGYFTHCIKRSAALNVIPE